MFALLRGVLFSTLQHMRTVGVRLFWSKLKFDGGQQSLSLDVHPDLNREQRISSCTIFYMLRKAGFITRAGERRQFCIPSFPSILIGQHNAGCYYDALFCQKIMDFVYTFLTEAAAMADRAFVLTESDSEGANMKTIRFRMSELPEHSSTSKQTGLHCVCGIHQNNLGIGETLNNTNTWLLAGLYAHASLLRL